MPSYRNISLATVASVQELLGNGANVVVREKQTKELVGRMTRLERPLERYLFLPWRHNDVFAQFAETMWMLAGRDDIAWLERYLPRAPDFSDDGETWRGAYGPRLRNWSTVDQIDAVRKLLTADRASRQAVMMLFDPARDYIASKDIPCNNWLGWIIRDNQLHLSAALRSSDVWWGFSGVNAFEWSVLQELLAFWVGADVGHADYFAMSLHLYEQHYERGAKMVDAFHGLSPYDFGLARAAFGTPWEHFHAKLTKWFELEAEIARDPGGAIGSYGAVGDPLLDSALTLAHVRWAHKNWGEARLTEELASLPAYDYVAAMYEEFGRSYSGLVQEVPQQPIAEFLMAGRKRATNVTTEFKSAVKKLHVEKDRAYGAAWKRRGELVSILPNIARKVDRLEALMATGAEMTGETQLDTAVDLLVYVEKYCLYLAERLEPGALLAPDAKVPLSDHDGNFDALLDTVNLSPGNRAFKDVVHDIVTSFDHCWQHAEAGSPSQEKLKLARTLAEHAGGLVAMIVHRDRSAVNQFLQSGSTP